MLVQVDAQRHRCTAQNPEGPGSGDLRASLMPHAYYDHAVITFIDGTTERGGGNRERVVDGVLHIWTEDSMGGVTDKRSYPLVSVRSWRWEGK